MLARGVTGVTDKSFAVLMPAASAPPDGRGGYVVDVVVDVVEDGARTKKIGAGP